MSNFNPRVIMVTGAAGFIGCIFVRFMLNKYCDIKIISFDKAQKGSSVTFTPRSDDSIMVRVDELKTACDMEDAVIWDVRSDGEYDGSNSRGNKRVGHIPGAVHLEWFNVVDRDSHQLKDPQEIRKILEERGITPDKSVYCY